MQVYQHMWNNSLLKVDKEQENLKMKELLKVEYDLDRIVQNYYKQISEARLLLTALREIVTDEEVMQNAYATFEKYIDLKEACRNWNRSTAATWDKTKKDFSKEIQMNKTDPAIMQRKELANVALAQTKKDERTQRQALEVPVLRTQKIRALKAKLKQQLANIATSSGSSTPGRIPATIDTSTSGGGSTTVTVTKEEMMQMFAKFT